MHWFFIAILAPIFWSVNTHFDKFILSKHSQGRGVGSVFLFSTFFSAVFAFGIFVFKGNEILSYSNLQNLFLFIIPGLLNALGFYFYLKSLQTEESSIVVALFQLSPVFAYFSGYLVLGETLTSTQVFASLAILLGAGILSFDIEDIGNKISIKWRMVSYIALAALCFAFNDVLFKKFTIYEGSFTTSLFWQHVGIFIIGLCFFFFAKNFRRDFFYLISSSRARIFVLNGTSEFFYVCGNLISNFATLLAPVALILVVNTYQAVFTFFIGNFSYVAVTSHCYGKNF